MNMNTDCTVAVAVTIPASKVVAILADSFVQELQS